MIHRRQQRPDAAPGGITIITVWSVKEITLQNPVPQASGNVNLYFA